MGIQQDKQKILIGLKKARGLLDRVTTMVEADRYCVLIMQQNLAVIGLLRSVHSQVLRNHLSTCFTEGAASGSPAKQKKLVAEIIRVNQLANK